MFYHYMKSALTLFASAMKTLLILLIIVVAFGVAYWIGDKVGYIAGKAIEFIL